MAETTIIGIDLAKRVFQLHGADASGCAVFRKKLARARLLDFLTEIPPCVVAMEACATAHFWGREIARLGHTVRLIPPIYVKPYVKRQKNDMADAEAIAEAATRPTMRFVAVKSEAQQARAMTFRTRDLLVRQRTQLINALRGHLAEFGMIAPQGRAHVRKLAEAIEDGHSLPQGIRDHARLLLSQIGELDERIATLEKSVRQQAKEDEEVKRLMTIPGIGPFAALAIRTFAPPLENFKSGRDFAAWTGLTPKQHSTGGKAVLGRISKMGQRDIRRLLIVGASTVVRWARVKGTVPGSWLERMLARKPTMLVITALANKMARMAWAISSKQTVYRDPMAA